MLDEKPSENVAGEGETGEGRAEQGDSVEMSIEGNTEHTKNSVSTRYP